MMTNAPTANKKKLTLAIKKNRLHLAWLSFQGQSPIHSSQT
jgi:hypothetical protein